LNKSGKSNSAILYLTAYLLILIFTLAAYSNTFNVPFHYDDIYVIRDNPHIRGMGAFLKSLPEKAQRPVLMLTFVLNYKVNSLHVTGYHIVNLLLHLLTSCILFYILNRTMILIYRKGNYCFSLISTLLFAVHPLATESVTYISSRSSLLSAFFILLGLFFFIIAYGGDDFKRPHSFLSLLAFVLAVGSKEISIIFPLLVLVYDFYFLLSKDKKEEKLKYFYAPSFFIALLLIFIKFRFVFKLASPDSTQRNFYFHIITELSIIPKFLFKFFIPVNLNIAHYFPLENSIFSFSFFFSIILWGALLFIIKTSFKHWRLLSFSLLWILITILPFILFPLSDLMSERWLYLSLAGISFFSVSLFIKLENYSFKRALIISGSLLVILFSAATYDRNNDYKSGISLWTDAVEKSPRNARAQGNLAYSCQMAGFPYKAIEYYEESLKIDPFYPATYYNLGTIYQGLGNLPKAVDYYRKDLRLNPRDFEAYSNLGIIFQNAGNPDRAINYFLSALKLKPSSAEAHSNLGMAYMSKGKIDKAIEEYESALSVKPESAEIHNNIAIAYAYKDLTGEAIMHFKKAITINPEFARAHFNLAALYKKLGKFSDAKAHYDEAVKLNPNFSRRR